MASANRGFQGAVIRMFRAPELRLRVLAAALECGGLMKRITFTSVDPFPDELFLPAAWIRLWFSTGDGREVQRAYTVASYSQERHTVDVSFYLHQTTGPAASGALHVRAGAEIRASVFGSRAFRPLAEAHGVALLGDETAFPAVRAIAASLPETTTVRVILTGTHDLSAFMPQRRGRDDRDDDGMDAGLSDTGATGSLVTGGHATDGRTAASLAAGSLTTRYVPVAKAARAFERMVLRGALATEPQRGAESVDERHTEHDTGAARRLAGRGDDMRWLCWAAGESSMMRAVRSALRHHEDDAVASLQVQGYWSARRLF